MTTPTTLRGIGLPQVKQLGHVVRDMDAAVKMYDSLYGPFSFLDGSVTQATYRGKLADCQLKVAFGYSGDLEIELIQWVSGESPHREFIERGREGIHHVQFRVDDAEGWIKKLNALGYETIWYKKYCADTIFAYLEKPGDPTIIEFLEMPPGGPGTRIKE
jgi:hypothetical protein